MPAEDACPVMFACKADVPPASPFVVIPAAMAAEDATSSGLTRSVASGAISPDGLCERQADKSNHDIETCLANLDAQVLFAGDVICFQATEIVKDGTLPTAKEIPRIISQTIDPVSFPRDNTNLKGAITTIRANLCRLGQSCGEGTWRDGPCKDALHLTTEIVIDDIHFGRTVVHSAIGTGIMKEIAENKDGPAQTIECPRAGWLFDNAGYMAAVRLAKENFLAIKCWLFSVPAKPTSKTMVSGLYWPIQQSCP